MENNINGIKKNEVEELLRYKITDKQFEEALEYAVKKQAYIYKKERRAVVLQPWYLTQLTMEYVKSLAFSKLTMDLCRTLWDMEKEHLFNELGAPTDNHILADCSL